MGGPWSKQPCLFIPGPQPGQWLVLAIFSQGLTELEGLGAACAEETETQRETPHTHCHCG